jgi:hypothetical protein
VDAFLGNTHLAAMMSQHKELQTTVEALVNTLDTTLIKVIWEGGMWSGGAAAPSLE